MLFRRHHITNGITKTETPVVEGKNKVLQDFVSVGVYAYSKAEAFGIQLSLFGSLIGVSFSLSDVGDDNSFSVGMDCPNSIAGGRNSIKLLAEDNPSKVANMAEDCHDEHDSCRTASGRVDVEARRANGTRFVNWGVCLITQKP